MHKSTELKFLGFSSLMLFETTEKWSNPDKGLDLKKIQQHSSTTLVDKFKVLQCQFM